PLRSILLSLSKELCIPLRHFDPAIRYCGDFYGQSGKGEPWPEGISVEHLARTLRDLPPGQTELCCHPAEGPPDFDSQYSTERQMELQVLCDSSIGAAITNGDIRLASFHRGS